MSDSYVKFQRRLDALTRKHKALAKGYTAVIGPDGLIELKPTAARESSALRFVFMAALCFVGIKGLTLALSGMLSYQESGVMQSEVRGAERADG